METKIHDLLSRRYKMTISSVKRTVGFEDLNFIVTTEICNSDMQYFGQNETRCVFKITPATKEYVGKLFNSHQHYSLVYNYKRHYMTL